MAIFAVIQTPGENGEKLANAVARAYPDAFYTLKPEVWLVSGQGTAQDVSNKLGISPGGVNGSGLVVEAASYYGRANPAVWTWIKNYWEGPPVV